MRCFGGGTTGIIAEQIDVCNDGRQRGWLGDLSGVDYSLPFQSEAGFEGDLVMRDLSVRYAPADFGYLKPFQVAPSRSPGRARLNRVSHAFLRRSDQFDQLVDVVRHFLFLRFSRTTISAWTIGQVSVIRTKSSRYSSQINSVGRRSH